MSLFSYHNVWNTCLLILSERGYHIFLIGEPDERGTFAQCTWNAEKGTMRLRGDNPIELLGLAAIYEYHQPQADSAYWWRIEGENLIAKLELEWRERIQANSSHDSE